MLKKILQVAVFTTVLFANDSAAILKSIQSGVEIHRNGTVLNIHESGTEVMNGDVIVTDVSGSTVVVFNDATLITLGNKSILKIDDYIFKPSEKKYNIELALNKGTAIFETGKIGALAPEKVAFKVPEGVIGIRGTRFFVEVK